MYNYVNKRWNSLSEYSSMFSIRNVIGGFYFQYGDKSQSECFNDE